MPEADFQATTLYLNEAFRESAAENWEGFDAVFKLHLSQNAEHNPCSNSPTLQARGQNPDTKNPQIGSPTNKSITAIAWNMAVDVSSQRCGFHTNTN